MTSDTQHVLTPTPWWIAYLTILFTTTLGLLSALILARRKDRREDIERHRAEHEKDAEWKSSIETRMAVLNTQVSPLWLVAQQKLSADLHHHGERYHDMDVLLEELDAMIIDNFPGHREELEKMLVARSQDTHKDITPDQRDSAIALLVIMRKVLVEAKSPGKLVNIGLVGVKEPNAGEGEHI